MMRCAVLLMFQSAPRILMRGDVRQLAFGDVSCKVSIRAPHSHAGRLLSVPSMFDSLEVEVLFTS